MVRILNKSMIFHIVFLMLPSLLIHTNERKYKSAFSASVVFDMSLCSHDYPH